MQPTVVLGRIKEDNQAYIAQRSLAAVGEKKDILSKRRLYFFTP